MKRRLERRCDAQRDFGGAASMLLFDPAFTAQEKSIAEALEGAELIEENEHCARAAHSPTVFLMPHMLSVRSRVVCHCHPCCTFASGNAVELA